MSYNNTWPTVNTSGLSLPDGPIPPDPFSFSLEQLELRDLMKNRHVLELHQNWTSASSTLVETTRRNNFLSKQNEELKAELDRLKAAEVERLKHNEDYPHFSPNINMFRNDSITPSESISHLARTPTPSIIQTTSHHPGRTAVRPDRYPESILWNFADLGADPDINIDENNSNRPPMQSVIRHENGDLIDTGLYTAIRVSGCSLIEDELFPLLPKNRATQNRPRTKKLFKDTCREAWNKVVRQYEEEQPLLTLCSGHWKAEYMLGSILASIQQLETRNKNKGKKTYAKGKSKVHTSSFSADTSELDFEIPSTSLEVSPPTSASPKGPPPASPEPDTTRKNHVSGKRARAGSSTSDQSVPPPLKKTKASESTPPAAAESLLHIRGVSSSSGSGAIATSMEIDSDFIIISTTYDDLKAILLEDFPQIKVAQDLLNSMKACPDFRSLPPSDDLKAFLARIEEADPNDTTMDDDNKGVGWGHYQFTAGSMTCASVMKSWEDIGNTDTARRLIAAAIRTCKVARYVCKKMNIKVTSYISDMYLERIIETLWDLWKLAGAQTITTTSQFPTAIPNSVNGHPNPNGTSTTPTAVAATQVEVSPSQKPLKDRLESLVKEDLKKWIDEHNVAVKSTNKLRSKDDLISAILEDPECQKPSQTEMDSMKATRSLKKKSTGRK